MTRSVYDVGVSVSGVVFQEKLRHRTSETETDIMQLRLQDESDKLCQLSCTAQETICQEKTAKAAASAAKPDGKKKAKAAAEAAKPKAGSKKA